MLFYSVLPSLLAVSHAASLSAASVAGRKLQTAYTVSAITGPTPWKVDVSEANVVTAATNIDLSNASLFAGRFSRCVTGVAGSDSDYTFSQLDAACSGTGACGVTIDSVTGTASVTITNARNIVNADTICVRFGLYFKDQSGWVEISSKEVTWDPTTTDGGSNTITSGQTGDNSLTTTAGTTSANTDYTAEDRADAETAVAATAPGAAVFGQATTWAITGKSQYYYTITSVTDAGASSLGNVGTLSGTCGTKEQGGHSTCTTVIPLNYFSTYQSVTATVGYSWYASNARRLLEEGASIDDLEPLGHGTVTETVQLDRDSIPRSSIPSSCSCTKEIAVAVSLLGLALVAVSFVSKKFEKPAAIAPAGSASKTTDVAMGGGD